MKRFIFLPVLFIYACSFAQGVSGAKPVIMDALGFEHISTDTLNSVAFKGFTLTAGNAIVITGTYPNFTIAMVQPTFTFPTRTFNTTFTVSTTKAAYLVYSITTSVTNPLLSGTSTATATLQYSMNAGSTWQNVQQIGQSSGVALTVTLQLISGQTQYLGGAVPANALVKITYTGTGTNSSSIPISTEYYY